MIFKTTSAVFLFWAFLIVQYCPTFSQTPCTFNQKCTCNGDNKNLTAVCENFSSFPQFNTNGNLTTLISLIVTGTFGTIPNYVFSNCTPLSLKLVRQGGDPKASLTIEDKAFVRLFIQKDFPMSFNTLEFVGFQGMIAVPTTPLSSVKFIVTLSFSNCSFSTIDGNSFKGVAANNLQLTQCGIKTISDNAFDNMANATYSLRQFNFDYNLLTAVPPTITQLDLYSLSLEYNQISNINSFQLPYGTNHSSLSSLLLNNNPIGDNIADNAFMNLSYLRYLYMDSIGLTKIPSKAIRPLTILSGLDVMNNQINIIYNQTFASGFVDLVNGLQLDYNPIKRIEPGAFEGLFENYLIIDNLLELPEIDVSVTHGVTKLAQMTVHNCPKLTRLTYADPSYPLPLNLARIELKDNVDIQSVDSNVKTWLAKSVANLLDISNNKHFICDNSSAWMAQFVVCDTPQIILTNTTCAGGSGQSLYQYLVSKNYKCGGTGGSAANVKFSFCYHIIILVISIWFTKLML